MEELNLPIGGNVPMVCMVFDINSEMSMDDIGFATEEDIFGSSEDDDQSDKNDNDEEADADINPDDLFGDETQENVGEDNKSQEVDQDQKDSGSSPKTKFYSSALKALKDDGVLPDLDDEFLAKVESPEDFAEAIEKQVAARMSESERRIKEALESKVEVDDIRKYENVLTYLNEIQDEAIEADTDEAITLRRQIIYQDLVNKGFKPERINKELDKSFNGGTDIDDAKAALESNKEHFQEEYSSIIEKAKADAIKERSLRDQKVKDFQKKVLETEDPFGLKIDKSTRQKIYENTIKPIHKDQNGKVLTTVQKYSSENPEDAEYYFSLFYTMTDGFKNVDKLVGQKVKQQSRSALRDLDTKLKNTPLNGDGSVDFDFGSKDSNSFLNNFKLDI